MARGDRGSRPAGQGAVDASLSREPLTGGACSSPGWVGPEVLAGGNVNARGGHLADMYTTGMRFADGLLQRSGYCQDGGRWLRTSSWDSAPEAEEWLVARLGST
jgi:hypothetical protein